jgi:hypothetical protein
MIFEIKTGKKLSKNFIEIFDKAKQIEFKSGKIFDFSKYHEDIFFILKDNNKIVAFGHLKKIKISYLGNKYNILGMANLISIEKKKGYGKQVVKEMIKFANKKNKTIVGFCQNHNKKFYEKCNIKLNKQILDRFLYKNSTNKYEDYVIYFEGKDNFIKKVISNKSKIILEVPFW